MAEKEEQPIKNASPVTTEETKPSAEQVSLVSAKAPVIEKKKKSTGKSFANFFYNPQRKTVLGRSSLNWAKLAAFYTIFYFSLGCFFTGLLYIFATILDHRVPTYYNSESTMAVRTTATVLGLGFRPQPMVDDSLIRITDDPGQKQKMASSLRLYRDVFLLQKTDAKVEDCTNEETAAELPNGVACAFNWFDIVESDDHPCSDNNMYGFKKEEPCVLVKLNKVYGWTPSPGPIPMNIQQLRGINNNKSVSHSDVYITCQGTNVADNDVLSDIVYYSLNNKSGLSKFGVIPGYYFPYRNAPDHVQPFVLVQFKKLPLDRLISVTCRAWSPGIEHDARAMRGMVAFQLSRSHKSN